MLVITLGHGRAGTTPSRHHESSFIVQGLRIQLHTKPHGPTCRGRTVACPYIGQPGDRAVLWAAKRSVFVSLARFGSIDPSGLEGRVAARSFGRPFGLSVGARSVFGSVVRPIVSSVGRSDLRSECYSYGSSPRFLMGCIFTGWRSQHSDKHLSARGDCHGGWDGEAVAQTPRLVKTADPPRRMEQLHSHGISPDSPRAPLLVITPLGFRMWRYPLSFYARRVMMS